MDWSRLPAEQVAALAEATKVTGDEDRLALGILCHHAKKPTLAMKYLSSLSGTALGEQARLILESTA